MSAARRDTWSLRRLVNLLLAAVLVFTVVVVAIGWLAFRALLDARHQVTDGLDPAAIAARDLRGAYVDQEAGLRGYVLSRQDDFLEPYRSGTEAAAEAATRLTGLAEDLPVRDDVAALVELGQLWHDEVAEPALDRMTSGDVEGAAVILEGGKARFDEFRAASADLHRQIADARVDGRSDLDRTTTQLVTSVVVIGAGLAASVLFTGLALRRWVLRPLDSIGLETRLVAGGDLAHRIVPSGPAELEAVALDAEAMRQRIVEELHTMEAARGELDAQARELARSNAELEQFAYVASHDLQEPLRKVASFCELLRRRYRGELDERADQYIDFAVDGAKRMQVLINDLLTFSRVGRFTDEPTDVDCDDLVAAACADLQLVMEETGAEVRAGGLPTVRGERTLLAMLFKNLMENAIKFRGDEPPVIEICAEPSEEPGTWSFRLSDNGIGIPPEYRDKVFVIFQRLHSRERYPGTGIGLALCRKIVEHHGGRMWIEDRGPGQQGTSFCWTLAHVTSPSIEEQHA